MDAIENLVLVFLCVIAITFLALILILGNQREIEEIKIKIEAIVEEVGK